MRPHQTGLQRKKYESPRLLVYGDIGLITQSTNNNPAAAADGGTIVGFKKTR